MLVGQRVEGLLYNHLPRWYWCPSRWNHRKSVQLKMPGTETMCLFCVCALMRCDGEGIRYEWVLVECLLNRPCAQLHVDCVELWFRERVFPCRSWEVITVAHLLQHRPLVHTFPRAASTFTWLNNQKAEPGRTSKASLSLSLWHWPAACSNAVENERLRKSPLIGINSCKVSML